MFIIVQIVHIDLDLASRQRTCPDSGHSVTEPRQVILGRFVLGRFSPQPFTAGASIPIPGGRKAPAENLGGSYVAMLRKKLGGSPWKIRGEVILGENWGS
jgi:hypothetical protein